MQCSNSIQSNNKLKQTILKQHYLLINLCLKINATGNPGCTLFNSECTISAGNTLRVGRGSRRNTTPVDSTRTQVRVQLPTSADNATLLAFAAERRAAAPLLPGSRRCRLISPAGAQQQTRRQRRAVEWSSNDLVHPIVVWVVTKWSKVNTTATTAAGALMRDATKCRLYTATQRLS